MGSRQSSSGIDVSSTPGLDGDQDQPLFADLIAQYCTDSICFTDVDGYTVWVNDAFVSMTGFDLADMIGKKPGEVLQGEDTDPKTVQDLSKAIKAEQRIRTEILNYSKSGEPYWIDITIVPVYDDCGTLTHFMSIERDVTDRKQLIQTTEAAFQTEQRHRKQLKTLSQMYEWLFAAQSEEEMHTVVIKGLSLLFPKSYGCLYFNKADGDTMEQTIHWGTGRKQHSIECKDCWSLRRSKPFSFKASDVQLSCYHVEDEECVYFCLPITTDGDTIGLLHITFPEFELSGIENEHIQKQISEYMNLATMCAEQLSLAIGNARLQTELRMNAIKDPLTSLWNRRRFSEIANNEVRNAIHSKDPLTVVMIDIDHFKRINDSLGHAAGDAVLVCFGNTLNSHFGGDWHTFRVGGEEFAVIGINKTSEDAVDMMTQFRKKLVCFSSIPEEHALPTITVSSGIATLQQSETTGALIKRSDKALYESKAFGRDRDTVSKTGIVVGPPAPKSNLERIVSGI